MSKVIIYTDGSYSPNHPLGRGGWGVVLIWGRTIKKMQGEEINTTNNRMELTAVINGLYALKWGCIVDLYTDSQYVQQGMMKWMHRWAAEGWPFDIKNLDLWRLVYQLYGQHRITAHWVRGHSGNYYNELADRLATGRERA